MLDMLEGVRGHADLAARLREAITARRMAPGARLPSQRLLAERLGLAVGTVTRAYAVLEKEGLLQSFVGRGTYVSFAAIAGTGAQADEIDLASDLPLEYLNPPIDRILADLSANLASPALTRYATSALDEGFAQTGALWCQMFGLDVPPRHIVPVLGAQHGILTALSALCRPGDTIVTEALTYPGLLGAARLLGLDVEGAAMDRHGILPDSVEDICAHRPVKALYVTPSLQNPTTGQIGMKRREALAATARRHDIAIIEDEARPRYVVHAPYPVATLAPERTLFIAGLSKILGGGLRAAFMVVPPVHRPAVDRALWAESWRVPALTMEVACRLVQSGAAYAAARRKEDEVARRRALMETCLAGFDVRTAKGSSHAWLILPPGWTAAAALEAASARKLAVTPPTAFWAGKGPAPDALRLTLGACEDVGRLEEGLARLADMLAGPLPATGFYV